MSRWAVAVAACALTTLPNGTHAQASPPDSTGRRLEPVVVTAERAGAPLAATPAAVTRLDAEALGRLTARTAGEALQYVPGITVLQGDGLGTAPRVVARGFYGGGETEYLTVLVDGVPTADLASGVVSWDLVPLLAVETVEVVRGGASSLYGDAAVGGVVNLITRRDRPFARWRAAGGAFGQAQLGTALGGHVGGREARVFGDVRRATGYRAHERRNTGSVGGSVDLARSASGSLSLGTQHLWRDFDEPGPLADGAVAADRRGAAPFNRFDATRDEIHRLTLSGTRAAGAGRTVSGYLLGGYDRARIVRTLPLSPEFADTKQRRTAGGRAAASVQMTQTSALLGVPSRLVVGADLTAGRLTSQYRNVVTGGAGEYAASSGGAGDVDVRGVGTRTTAAGFATWEATPVEALRLTLGGRVDWIEDRYTPRAPSDGLAAHATRAAFSPRAGVNVRYASSARQTGHLYVTAGRSFKAPTIDQLFDQRRTPVPFPPYAIATSNARLEAQYGTSVEAGAYHSVSLVPNALDARLSLSAYQTDMRNELDFDLEQFRYVNIGRSRHRGVETGLTLSGPRRTAAFATYAFQRATSRLGEDRGRLLKAIPEQVLTAGLSRTSPAGLSASLGATVVGRTFLDDANAIRLGGHAQLDLRTSYPVLGARLSLDVRNLLGREFSSTGFPDPAGSPLVYLYPAAGRVVLVGLEARP